MTDPLWFENNGPMVHWFFIIFIQFSMGLELPTQLTSSDQIRSLEILGLGTTAKFLSNAYPLGGYSGLELSLSASSFDTKEISTLGAGAPQTDMVYFPTITIGKGIYNNSDLFFHFIPASKTAGLSSFGFSFRWSFYQALFLPLNFSMVAHGNSSNIESKMITRNLGFDLMMGLSLSQFSFFLGGGWANSAGKFTGGTQGITASGNSENQKVESSHFMFGATYNFEPFFIALSIDRYKEEVYSTKVGFLF